MAKPGPANSASIEKFTGSFPAKIKFSTSFPSIISLKPTLLLDILKLEAKRLISILLLKLANSDGLIPPLKIPTRFEVVIPEKCSCAIIGEKCNTNKQIIIFFIMLCF